MFKPLQRTFPLYLFIDIFFITAIFYLAYIFRYNPLSASLLNTGLRLPNCKEYSFIYALWTLFITTSFKRNSLYTTDRSLVIPREILRSVTNIAYASILVATVIFFAQYKFVSRYLFVEIFMLLSVFLSGWRTIKRIIVRKLIVNGFHNINILIIGAGSIGTAVAGEVTRNPYWGFNIVGFLDDNKDGIVSNKPILGRLNIINEVIRKHFVDEVIITIPSEKRTISELMAQLKKMRIGISVVPENFEAALPALDVVHLGIMPLLTYKERKRHPAEFLFKRLFDFIVALVLVLLLSPILIIVGILIKLNSHGPIFYIQRRTGFKGKEFNLYKFRSMIKEADIIKASLLDENESKGDIIFKMKKDPRVTKIGSLLRRFSFDELPQLFNVLKGDMSIVGPRPFPIKESHKLGANHMGRLAVRPGITGLAQVKGRSDLSFYQWVKWDLWYVNHWSFWLDFRILVQTIPAVLKGEGAY